MRTHLKKKSIYRLQEWNQKRMEKNEGIWQNKKMSERKNMKRKIKEKIKMI